MKKLLLMLLLLPIYISASAELINPLPLQDDSKSTIIFYREYNYVGSAVPYRIYMNDSILVRLKNESFFRYECQPGDYNFSIQQATRTNIVINCKAGKTYYVRFGIRPGFFQSYAELLLVDSLSAAPVINNGALKDITNNPPVLRPKNRIALNMNMGGGFYSTKMVTMTDGDDSKISFGGGFGIGLKYGREIGKHFDISTDLTYQFSELRPYLSNANITVSKGILSVTPAIILPINDGESMRFKIGGGLDYYFSNGMKIETTKLLYGINDNWSYKSSLGYHACVNFEMNFSEKWLFNYGLNWYTAKFDFEKSDKGIYKINIDPDLLTPDGSGIDFILGIAYCF